MINLHLSGIFIEKHNLFVRDTNKCLAVGPESAADYYFRSRDYCLTVTHLIVSWYRVGPTQKCQTASLSRPIIETP